MFNRTSKYFKNTPPAGWAAHITRDFLTSYFCSYYSSMHQGNRIYFYFFAWVSLRQISMEPHE